MPKEEIQLPECPEVDKMVKVSEESNNIGAFLDWLNEQGISLGEFHRHDDQCRGEDGFISCGCRDGELVPIIENFEKLLARYFNIDLNKVEQEKSALLDAIRKTTEVSRNGT